MLPVAKDLEQLKVVFGWSDLMYTQVLVSFLPMKIALTEASVRMTFVTKVHQRLDVSRPLKISGQVRAVCDAVSHNSTFICLKLLTVQCHRSLASIASLMNTQTPGLFATWSATC